MGAMHPLLFFVVVYGISLFLAFFICSAVYNNLHPDGGGSVAEQKANGYVLAQAKVLPAVR